MLWSKGANTWDDIFMVSFNTFLQEVTKLECDLVLLNGSSLDCNALLVWWQWVCIVPEWKLMVTLFVPKLKQWVIRAMLEHFPLKPIITSAKYLVEYTEYFTQAVKYPSHALRTLERILTALVKYSLHNVFGTLLVLSHPNSTSNEQQILTIWTLALWALLCIASYFVAFCRLRPSRQDAHSNESSHNLHNTSSQNRSSNSMFWKPGISILHVWVYPSMMNSASVFCVWNSMLTPYENLYINFCVLFQHKISLVVHTFGFQAQWEKFDLFSGGRSKIEGWFPDHILQDAQMLRIRERMCHSFPVSADRFTCVELWRVTSFLSKGFGDKIQLSIKPIL